MDEIFELSPDDEDNAIRCDRGVSFVSPADRHRHAPDRCVLAVRRGALVARCSCWWRATASLNGTRLGVIGHYAAVDADAGAALLSHACDVLAGAGCTTAAGPMDGTTWRRYRLIVERGDAYPFFLEPDNPNDWAEHWSMAGFSPLATYTSAVNDDLETEDPRTSVATARLSAAGISIRAFDPAQGDADLRRIFELAAVSFSRNFLYSRISEDEFLEQHRAVLPFVRPELILLAEREQMLVGFIFVLPDMLQARRGVPVDTVVLKTLAVNPAISGIGVGGVLTDLVQRRARQMGFRRAIHALMHDTNVSRRISDRYARTIRRYALLSRPLAPGRVPASAWSTAQGSRLKAQGSRNDGSDQRAFP